MRPNPASRWSRPITIGALSSPLATISLNRSPARWRSPYPSQQIRAGSPWNLTFSRARRIQRRCSPGRQTARGSPRRSGGCPPDRPTARPSGMGPCPRRTAGGCRRARTPDRSTRPRRRTRSRQPAQGVAVVEGLGARLLPARGSRATCVTSALADAPQVLLRIAGRAARRPARSSAPPGCSR